MTSTTTSSIFWSEREVAKSLSKRPTTSYSLMTNDEYHITMNPEPIASVDDFFGPDLGAIGYSNIVLYWVQTRTYLVQGEPVRKRKRRQSNLEGSNVEGQSVSSSSSSSSLEIWQSHSTVVGLLMAYFNNEQGLRWNDDDDSKTQTASITVHALGILPDYRSMSDHGARFMHEFERWCKGFLERNVPTTCTHLQISLDSVFPQHMDDRAIHFYKRLGYQIRGFLFGTVQMSKRIELLSVRSTPWTKRESLREHLLYEMDQHDNTVKEISELFVENGQGSQSENISSYAKEAQSRYLKNRAADDCRRYRQSKRYDQQFPDLQSRYEVWRAILRENCDKGYGLAQYESKQEQRLIQTGVDAYRRMVRELEMVQQEAEKTEERRYKRSNFEHPYVWKFVQLLPSELQTLSKQMTPFWIHASFLSLRIETISNLMDLKMTDTQWEHEEKEHPDIWSTESDNGESENTLQKSEFLNAWHQTFFGGMMLSLIAENEQDFDSWDEMMMFEFVIQQIQIKISSNEDEDRTLTLVSFRHHDDMYPNRVALLLAGYSLQDPATHTEFQGNVLAFPGTLQEQWWWSPSLRHARMSNLTIR